MNTNLSDDDDDDDDGDGDGDDGDGDGDGDDGDDDDYYYYDDDDTCAFRHSTSGEHQKYATFPRVRRGAASGLHRTCFNSKDIC